MKSVVPYFVIIASMLWVAPSQSAQQQKTPQELENLANELVRTLGNPDFQKREAASRELAELGLAARKAIDEGRKSPDPEIRFRCESLYPMICILDLKRRIEVFAADEEGRIENNLPLGASFEKICGKDANGRKFFIELCQNNLQLFDDAANDPQRIGEGYFDLPTEIRDRRNKNPSPPGVEVDGTLSAIEIASLFLIGTDEKIGPIVDEANRKQPERRNYKRVVDILWQSKYEAAMNDANYGRYYRKLLFAWAKRLTDPLAMQSFLFFMQDMIKKQAARMQSDPDTLEFLKDFAVSTSSQQMPFQKGTAMAMIAAASIPNNDKRAYFEEKLLKDETTLLPEVQFNLNESTKIIVQTRACDYALATCVKFSGQSFQDYGFDILGSRSDVFANWEYAGFTKDETRKAALKKYEEWRKDNPTTKD